MDIEFLLQLTLNGLVLGAVYALVALGLSLIFGVLGIVNFAHGEFYMLAAMLAYFITSEVGLDYWSTTVLVIAASLVAGIVVYELLMRFIQGKDFQRAILVTLGLSMILQNGAIFLWTANPRVTLSSYTYVTYMVGEIRIGLVRVLALAMAVVAFALVYWILNRTMIGKAMRGVAQNREAALIVGIDPRAVSRLAVVMGVGLSGLAGAALAPVYSAHPLMGFAFIFKVFAITIVGGLGSFSGPVVAAVLLGIAEGFIGGFLPLIVTDILVFTLMLLVLMVRPDGLFGRGVRI